MPDKDDIPWYDFIGYRRRFISDLAWFGLAIGIVGIVVTNESSSWLRCLGLLVVAIGVGMVALAIRRRLRSGR